jgi:hypothetical protein
VSEAGASLGDGFMHRIQSDASGRCDGIA